ncbi:rhombotarget lipoprotein [Pleionea mediterranea]|uniref:Rhombotail lipoprotein n=1 Tax=Pleionea mediterranea TaxID=523701 RepID=A0A316G0G9_9GAMM|nr:rhombotarget lipoprotein [Pleionea mediterranea]PWK53855.1 rhombotail lipoprotein [Pleionea mediterranea]
MNNVWKVSLILLTVIFVLAGCAGQQTRSRSSVVDYLYPSDQDVAIKPSVPVLKLPVKVGIAFVPSTPIDNHATNFWTGKKLTPNALTSVAKAELLEQVASQFREREYVQSIELIPTEYLSQGGGFSNLDQIKTMFDIDIIALVSHDQTQFTDENYLSLTYWSIVGAYIIKGEINDTNTMMDTVVYDISSRKMLFRAPGKSVVKGSATPVNLSEQLRNDSIKGFELAADEMIKNLSLQLEVFKNKIKNKTEDVKVVHRKNYTGGGAPSLLIFIILASLSLVRNRNS